MANYPDDPPIYADSDTNAQSHLDWLFTLVAGFQGVYWALKAILGSDGVIAYTASGPPTPTDSLKTEAQGTPDMTFNVLAGAAMVSGKLCHLASDYLSATQAGPNTNPRIDTVQFNSETWEVSIKTGAEAASPTAPTVDAACIKLAEIYHRVGTSSIKDSDDSTNSYITDARVYCNA